ncbi:hypothetical protein ONQ62_29140, partial [Salmonella enterica subsp. enterica serovar Virginia]|nr:hypothetical protein [Salmonella enterica subsp. enterica serovar Virginia]
EPVPQAETAQPVAKAEKPAASGIYTVEVEGKAFVVKVSDGGDMLDLWMSCRGINLHQAMQEAKAFLGIKDDDHHFDARR